MKANSPVLGPGTSSSLGPALWIAVNLGSWRLRRALVGQAGAPAIPTRPSSVPTAHRRLNEAFRTAALPVLHVGQIRLCSAKTMAVLLSLH